MKFNSTIFLAFLILFLAGCAVSSIPSGQYEDVNYLEVGENITITGLSEQGQASSILEIPSRIKDKPVTKIAQAAFKGSSLTKVSIPDSVSIIENEAFNHTESLTEVEMGTGVAFIGHLAFTNTALSSVIILAPQPPALASSFAETFSSSQEQISLSYSIGGTGYDLTPWNGFENQTPYLDPQVIEDVRIGYKSLTLALKNLANVTYLIVAHKEQDFSDEGILADFESTPQAPLGLSLTGLNNGTSYYLRVRGMSQQGDVSNWISPPHNPPYIPRANPEVTVTKVESKIETITVTVTALPGVSITVSAHTQEDFSDRGISSDPITITESPQDINLSNLVGGTSYYLRVLGENSLGETNNWMEIDGNPHQPFSLGILDAIPRSTTIGARVGAPNGVTAKMQLSTDVGFNTITNESSFLGAGSFIYQEITGLTDRTTYYLRLILVGGNSVYTYSTPLIPTPNGTQHIHRLSELAKIGVDMENYPPGWDYILEKDLNFADANNDGIQDDPYDNDQNAANGNWDPLTIGMYGEYNEYKNGGYNGHFDGNDHSISGMNIVASNTNAVGLFGTLGDGGEIKKLRLLESEVVGLWYTGGLVGHNYQGMVINSYTTGTVSGQGRVGGIIGWNDKGTLTGSFSTATVLGIYRTGGLVGRIDKGFVTNSYSLGDVSGLDRTGGLVGYNNEGTIRSSYATGNISGSSSTGGLAGSTSNGTISGCYATGNVSGDDENIGGLFGENNGSGLINHYRYENQNITNLDGSPHSSPNTEGSPVTLSQLKTPSWYTATLGWDSNDWLITSLVNADPAYHPHILQSGTSTEVPGQPNHPIL